MTVVNVERVADTDGLRPQTRAVMFGVGLTVTSVPDGVIEGSPDAKGSVTGYERVDADGSTLVTPAAVVAAIAGQAIAPASITLPAGAMFTLGPFTGAAGSFITTDGTSGHAVARAPLAVNMGATFLIIAEGICTTSGGGDVGRIYTYQSEPAASITTGGSPSISNSPSTTSTFTGSPTNPSLDLVYGGGFLTLGATGVAGDTIKWSAAILLVASG